MMSPAKAPTAHAGSPTPPAEPRWLTPQERRAWLALADLVLRLPAVLDRDMQQDAELTFFEYMVLGLLSEQPDRSVGMTELADLTSSSLSRLSHVVKRLETQGLILRTRCPGVGRRTNAVVTDAGFARVNAAAPAHVERVRHYVVDVLTTEELRVLAKIGQRVSGRLQQADPPSD